MKLAFLKTKAAFLWLAMSALALAACFGYRCPAPGCPCCKIVGE